MEILIVLLVLVVVTLYKGINIVPEGEEWIVERLGKFSRTLFPGLNIIIPYIEIIRQKISTRDIILDIPKQEVITKDNAVIHTNAVTFIRVTKPENAIYGVEDFRLAIQQLVMTTLRSILGEMNLDEALSNREHIKAKLKSQIIDDVSDWGVTVKSVEIQDIAPSPSMQASMERQAAAERERRAIETIAEGNKNAMVLEADGKLASAEREAAAQIKLANASAEAIRVVSQNTQNNELPVMFLLGEKYINSLEKISQSQNGKFVIYPADLQIAIKGLLGGILK